MLYMLFASSNNQLRECIHFTNDHHQLTQKSVNLSMMKCLKFCFGGLENPKCIDQSSVLVSYLYKGSWRNQIIRISKKSIYMLFSYAYCLQLLWNSIGINKFVHPKFFSCFVSLCAFFFYSSIFYFLSWFSQLSHVFFTAHILHLRTYSQHESSEVSNFMGRQTATLSAFPSSRSRSIFACFFSQCKCARQSQRNN